MSGKLPDCAQERLSHVFAGPACTWCKYPYKPIYRTGLCRHCYGIKSELKRTYRDYLVAKRQSYNHHQLFTYEHYLRTALGMAESAHLEGRTYGALHKAHSSNLDLEREFGFLSRMLLGNKDVFHHGAHLFECFSVSQKAYLQYLLSRLTREHFRRTRRQRNVYHGEPLEQAFKKRFQGTYRVEDDVKLDGVTFSLRELLSERILNR